MNKYQEQTENLGAYCDKYAITLCDIKGNNVTTLLASKIKTVTVQISHGKWNV